VIGAWWSLRPPTSLHRQAHLFFLFLTTVLAVPSTSSAQCEIAQGKLGNFQTVVMENEFVRVSVLPQIGGRIFEYTLKSSGNNQLYAEVEKLEEFKPGDEIPRGIVYNISGYEDIIKESGDWHWPGDFQQVPYALEILADSPDEATIRLSAAGGSVRIERTHTLTRDSATLSHMLKVTNSSEEEIEMMLRHKAGTRVGGEARMGDAVAYPSKSGVVRKPFFPGNIWFDFLLTDGWVAASDPLARETFLITSDFESLSNGGLWFDKQYFYNLEFFGRKQMVPAGESVTLDTQWHVFDDFPLITFAADGFLGYFAASQGEERDVEIDTGIIALEEIGTLSVHGLLYYGPNRIDDFETSLETTPLGSTRSTQNKNLLSPVDEVRAEFTMEGSPVVKLDVPLIDTEPPEPVVLNPLAEEPYRYSLHDEPAYHLWVESTAGHIRPDEVFEDSKPPRNLVEIDVLPNEYECFQLAIRSKQGDIEGIEPVFEDLKEVNCGATLGAGSFGFYRGATVPQVDGALFDPLVPDSPVTACEETNAMLFVELHCDPMQLPGVYEGEIRFRSDGQEIRPVKVRVKVRSFRMPHARSVDTAFWIWKTWTVKGANNTDFWPNLARYRLSPGWLKGQFHAAEEVEFLDAEGAVRTGNVEVGHDGAKAMYAEALHDLNINRICPGYNIWGYADTHEWKHRLVRNARAQTDWLDRNGLLDRCYYQIVDEPLASRFGQLQQVIKLYRQANPDYTIMCTMPINPDLYGYIDMWHVPWGALDPDVAAERQKLGEKVWCYNANRDITGVGKLPRLIGWFCWKYKLDGYMHYAVDYTDSETTHSPWEKTGSRWATFFYPSQNKWDPELGYWENSGTWDWALPSIRLMQIRDGFEDYEYMKLLERWVLLAKRHGRNERNQALIAEAEAMLKIEDNFIGNFISYTQSPEDMMEARRRVGDMIERLRLDVTGEQF
jgi:hypothetical protein